MRVTDYSSGVAADIRFGRAAVSTRTDQSYAGRKLISFRAHGRLETPFAPVFVPLPRLAGPLPTHAGLPAAA